MRILFLLILFFIGLTAGCANIQTPTSVTSPTWILNPNLAGNISVVGSAARPQRGGREAQYRVAKMKAFQELAAMRRVQVESTNRAFTSDEKGKTQNSMTVDSKLTSRVALTLDEVKVVREWVDPQDGTLYLWMMVPE